MSRNNETYNPANDSKIETIHTMMNLNEFGQGDYGVEDEFEDLEVYNSEDDTEADDSIRLT